MPAALDSKTVIGLLVLLAVMLLLVFTGHLTDQAVDVLKWVGGAYMAVRVTANATENLGKKDGT